MTRPATSHAPLPATLAARHKVWAYVKKEFLIELSYKFAFLLYVFGVFTSVATYFFIDRLFGSRVVPDLEPFGTPYFAYVLVGNAFFAYVGAAIGGVSGYLASEQSRGTLEVLFATPTRLRVLLLAMAIWNTLYASVEAVAYFFVGALAFGVDFSQINWGTLLSVSGLVIVVFNSIGLIEAAFILVFKRGAVVAWVVNGAWALLGGVFFPVTVLPDWLQLISALNPITYAIRALQLGIYRGTPVTELGQEIAVLTLFAVAFVPLGLLSWSWAVRRARTEGTLALH